MTKLRTAARAMRWLPGVLLAGPTSERTTADLIERRAATQPSDVFLRFEGREVCYAEFNAAANRVAHWALGNCIGTGDVVALIMENRPEYLEIWAGLAKVGATTALINTNLTGEALARVVKTSGARHVIVGSECLDAWRGVPSDAPVTTTVHIAADPYTDTAPPGPRHRAFTNDVARYSAENPPRAVRDAIRGSAPLFYIYTSGTTGLPKAARFSHARFAGGGIYALLAGFNRNDTMLCTLPLYHTVGGVMCVSAVLRAGATLALVRRFSASTFWRTAAETKATAFQYIGELCRYLLAQPTSEWEARHRIRLCVGNGLRPDIWEQFQKRFALPHIVEFYGATESNVSLVNLEGRTGSIGRPAPGSHVALVRYDVAEQRHLRDEAGFCLRCESGEAGELLGRIRDGKTAAGRFEGYTSKEESEKKILRDVFKPGDAWFRTGDLLRRDEDGHFYFVDRCGDTFRWKGENVSTQEVSEALTRHEAIELAAVYGVTVPGCEGRAGMAALVLAEADAFDGAAFYDHVEHALPPYARPAFVRLQSEAVMTGTFKLRKTDLQHQGFEPRATEDPIFYRNDEREAYVPLTVETQSRIVSGEIRL